LECWFQGSFVGNTAEVKLQCHTVRKEFTPRNRTNPAIL
jgi:hypothetical protein